MKCKSLVELAKEVDRVDALREYAVEQGAAIGADAQGYFLIKTRDELDEYLPNLACVFWTSVRGCNWRPMAVRPTGHRILTAYDKKLPKNQQENCHYPHYSDTLFDRSRNLLGSNKKMACKSCKRVGRLESR